MRAILACLLTGSAIAGAAQPRPAVAAAAGSAETLVFFGDSLAFPEPGLTLVKYPVLVEACLRQWRPRRRLVVFNASLPGQTSAQGAARFDADVAPLAPTLVVVQFGTNDPSVSAAAASRDPAGPPGTRAAQALLARKSRSLGARAITLTPLPVEFWRSGGGPGTFQYLRDGESVNETDALPGAGPAGARRPLPAYNDLLAPVARDVAAGAATVPGTRVVDLFAPILALHRKAGRDGAPLILTTDGVHPNAAGHLVMAYYLLRRLGEPPPPIELDLTGGRPVRVREAVVDRWRRDAAGMHLRLRFGHLPLAIGADAAPALAWVPFEREFNRCTLVVRDWPVGRPLTLVVDGRRLGTFEAETVRRGIDLAGLTDAPWFLASAALQQAASVRAVEQRRNGSTPLPAGRREARERSLRLADAPGTGPWLMDLLEGDPEAADAAATLAPDQAPSGTPGAGAP